MKNTFIDLELENGEKIQLTLNFMRLLKLKNARKDIYEKYNKILIQGTKDGVEDTLTTLYTAYLCANVDNLDNIMNFETFMKSVPQDFVYLNSINNLLLNPKKKTALENHSSRIQEK